MEVNRRGRRRELREAEDTSNANLACVLGIVRAGCDVGAARASGWQHQRWQVVTSMLFVGPRDGDDPLPADGVQYLEGVFVIEIEARAEVDGADHPFRLIHHQQGSLCDCLA
jgi:hypothetical protein